MPVSDWMGDLRDLYRTYGHGALPRRVRHELRRHTGAYMLLRSRVAPPASWRPPPLHALALHELYRRHADVKERIEDAANQLLRGRYRYFSAVDHELGWPPRWFHHVRTGKDWRPDLHWSRYSTRDHDAGDIKWIWEPSRFGFAWLLGRAHVATGRPQYARAFWRAFEDWLEQNPPYQGPNWACGQETALRVFAVQFATRVFRDDLRPARVRFIEQFFYDSARRIELALDNALSQRNNHALSELVALWTIAVSCPGWGESAAWRARAEEHLRRALADQFERDGAYIQESFTYHRVALHVLGWLRSTACAHGAEVPAGVDEALERSLSFLGPFLEPSSGRLPNYGANDGALVLPLSDAEYRDFRPLLQHLAAALRRPLPLGPGPWDEERLWLGLDAPAPEVPAAPVAARELRVTRSGYVSSRLDASFVFTRASHHEDHRPSHADALHVDLWLGPRNLALDPGTYSYTSPPPWDNSLARTRVHNTCSVGDRDQMRRVSRFLWTRWSKARVLEASELAGAHLILMETHADSEHRISHRRLLLHRPGSLVVLDALAGVEPACLRLHWNLEGTTWSAGDGLVWRDASVEVEVEAPAEARAVAHRGDEGSQLGWHSPAYGHKLPCTAIDVEVEAPAAAFATTFRWGGDAEPLPTSARQQWGAGQHRACFATLASYVQCITG